MDFEHIKFLVETVTSPQVLLVLLIAWLILFKPKILDRIATLDVAGVKLELRELKASVERTKHEIEEVSSRLDAVTEQYIETAESFDPLAAPKDIDKVGAELKSYAASLDNIDFVLEHLTAETEQSRVYAAGCAIQVRPQAKFLIPLSDYIKLIANTSNLHNIRLRVVYKLVQAMENIIRSDNKKPQQALSHQARIAASHALESLRKHSRAEQDFVTNGNKSLVWRIDRTLKLI